MDRTRAYIYEAVPTFSQIKLATNCKLFSIIPDLHKDKTDSY